MNVNKITQNDSGFPEKLRLISSSPKELYILGDIEPLVAKKVVSIVGSRAVTPYGRQITTRFAGQLAEQGIAVVSGLALGVDGLAHAAALDAGGYTVAVLPSSVTEIYPTSHRQLAKRILASGGALMSEYPDGSLLNYKANFIARNRLVSGLADALLITEASERSGTLHTANFALEQGKTVMAVPGNITSPTSIGTNNLIKTGAIPVTDIGDILTALGITEEQAPRDVVAATPEEAAILNAMKTGVSDSTELIALSQLPPAAFNQTLTMLEISGKIRPLGAGHWTIV